MLKKLMLCLALLVLAVSAAMAEELVLVDRINAPEEHADFAFEEGVPLLEIIFPQILDTDAAVLRCGDQVVLIDCSSKKYAQRVVNLLVQMGVEEIDAMINTHPHYDHLQGLEILAQNVKVKELRMCFPAETTEHAQVALDVCAKYGIPVTYYADGQHWDIGGASVDVWLKGDDAWGLNDRSASMRVQFGQRTMLFTADAEFKLQRRLLEVIPAELLKADVLKYPHHGTAGIDANFLQAVAPKLAILTSNGGSRSKDAKYALRKQAVPMVFTVPGYVCLRTDGTTWIAERLPMDVPVNNPSRPDVRFQ